MSGVGCIKVPLTPHHGGELSEASSLPPGLPPTSPTAWDKADGPSCPAVSAGRGGRDEPREQHGNMYITIRETDARGNLLHHSASSSPVLCDNLGRGQGARWEGGACVYLWLIPTDVWQKPTQYCNSVQFNRSVVSDSLRPHESQHARPPCPSPTPGVHSNSRPSSQ